MQNPLRAIVAVLVVVALLALRAWFRSDSSRNASYPQRPPASVEHARVLRPESPRRGFSPFPAGDLRGSECRFAFAVYHDPLPRKPPEEVVAALAPKFPGLHRTDDPSKTAERPIFKLVQADTTELPPPAPEDLKYFGRGLSAADVEKLQKSGRVTAFFFMGKPAEASGALRQGHDFVAEFAAETGGWLWDAETRECFTAASWASRGESGWDKGVLDIRSHITIHLYRRGSLLRAVTLGMWKFGLPDVCATGLTGAEGPQVESLVNIVCQAMFERGRLDAAGVLPVDVRQIRCERFRDSMVGSLLEGATGRADVEVGVGTPEEGDAENRQIRLGFEKPEGATETERRLAFFGMLFGGRESLTLVEHDAEILAARDRARAKLLKEVKADFLKGLAPGGRLSVKAPFRTSSGGNEWMWIEVVEWKGTEVTGILMNEPMDCPGLKEGARVEAKEDSLFDYILVFPDGHEEGNETGAIMERREREGR